MVLETKTLYEAPTSTIVEVRMEGIIANSPTPNSASYGYDDDNDLGEI